MIKALTVLAAIALVTPAEARPRHGSCDGIHRCICGSTQARHFNLPRFYNCHNLWQAIEWTRAFPRTTPHAGVVMYQHGGGPTGHVSRLVSNPVGCFASVADESGTYERNICLRGAVFVEVRTGVAALARASAQIGSSLQ